MYFSLPSSLVIYSLLLAGSTVVCPPNNYETLGSTLKIKEIVSSRYAKGEEAALNQPLKEQPNLLASKKTGSGDDSATEDVDLWKVL
ncbi:hypothetical protein PGT21_024145 [Puccinia graminis f. sp. tritici]|uniref:Uncharacterized protein n=1 Tax=Puccinia graminis f. sp. tritici TaxID=56615 RepID=A0A5B0M3I7_PUCGR|nr:hypothetical protein PGT21_024145 [Puccinia graminis f. sp. tritici]